MKLLRCWNQIHQEIELAILHENRMIPLSALLEEPPADLLELLNSEQFEKLQKLSIPADAPRLQPEEIEYLPPIPHPGKIVCIGLNYRDHVLEGGREIPAFPTIFLKAPSAIIGHREPIQLPPVSNMVDYEAELAVVIGKRTTRCPAAEAYGQIAGYTILNDVTARDYQRRTSQWTLGKSCDTFAPLGPVLVTADEIQDPHNLTITSTLNGNEMQRSNTRHLIFTIPFLIEYISSVMTLEPGDILSTGTPGGVGVFREPPIFLRHGDRVEITIEQIGSLVNPVIEASV